MIIVLLKIWRLLLLGENKTRGGLRLGRNKIRRFAECAFFLALTRIIALVIHLCTWSHRIANNR